MTSASASEGRETTTIWSTRMNNYFWMFLTMCTPIAVTDCDARVQTNCWVMPRPHALSNVYTSRILHAAVCMQNLELQVTYWALLYEAVVDKQKAGSGSPMNSICRRSAILLYRGPPFVNVRYFRLVGVGCPHCLQDGDLCHVNGRLVAKVKRVQLRAALRKWSFLSPEDGRIEEFHV